jgi:hypothetical protein
MIRTVLASSWLDKIEINDLVALQEMRVRISNF